MNECDINKLSYVYFPAIASAVERKETIATTRSYCGIKTGTNLDVFDIFVDACAAGARERLAIRITAAHVAVQLKYFVRATLPFYDTELLLLIGDEINV